MKYIKILKFRYLLLTCLSLFKVSIIQAYNPSFVIDTPQPTHQTCRVVLTTDIKETPLIESEQQLRDQGYTDKYIAGFDHVIENLQLAERLRSHKIDPSTSHIKEFADLIDRHIEFIERGISSQESSDKQIRLNALDLLKAEAQQLRDSKQVTYQWLFGLNFRLSIIATPKEHLYFKDIQTEDLVIHKTIEDIDKLFKRVIKKNNEMGNHFMATMINQIWSRNLRLVHSFPEEIIIPTIHNLGIMSINNTHGTGVHFIGLNNNPFSADRREMYPDHFFQHDIQHNIDLKHIDNIDDLQLTRYVRHKIAALPRLQREVLEYIFFGITHEDGFTLREYFTDVKPRHRERPKGFGIDEKSIRKAEATLTEILRTNPYILFQEL